MSCFEHYVLQENEEINDRYGKLRENQNNILISILKGDLTQSHNTICSDQHMAHSSNL